MNMPAPRSLPVRIVRYLAAELYAQVLIAVVLGILVGLIYPSFGKTLAPLGVGFIKLIQMIIAPIIFCTIVTGVASMGDLKRLGRVGFKTILYFEVISTFALVIGLVVVNVLKPGVGFNIDPSSLDPRVGQSFVAQAHSMHAVDFILNIIPSTFFSAFATGQLLQVLFVAILTALALSGMGEAGKPALHVIEVVSKIFFGIIRIIVKAAPLGAFGAMAFTVGDYGVNSLNRLLIFMAEFYLTAGLFIIVVLGGVAHFCGFNIFRFLLYIKDELLLVVGTASSETALPGMLEKLERVGCPKATVGLVIPTGYSFNLDGTNIYMTMAAIFLAQATNTHLTLWHQLSLLLIAMISSKGACGVTGAGFVTLAATLTIVPEIPIASLALLVGIDRFMSDCRAVTNQIGNGVATIAISRWENEISKEELQANLKQLTR